MRGLFLLGVAACVCVLPACAQNSAGDLIELIRGNDLPGLKARFAQGADVNTRDARGTTLLMHASAIGSPDAVKLLLDSGADANAKNELDATALILGASNIEKARLLVAKGADVNAHSKLGRMPLLIAASCAGCSPTVKLLLDKGADPNAADERGNTAMLAAANISDLDSMKLLLAKGAGADTPSKGGDTPLQFTAMNCDVEAARLLLAKGANVNSANTASGEVKFGKIQLIGLTPLMLAATYCPANMVKLLLDAGAKVNVKDVRGMTPLVFGVSSESQSAEVVKLLLKAGAEVNARSSVEETALDWAARFGNRQVTGALTAAGAKSGTPFHAPEIKLAGTRPVMQAVESGTALLQRSSSEFFKQSGCVGCHHQPVTLLSVAAARSAGAHVDEALAKETVRMIDGENRFFNQPLLERVNIGGLTDSPTWKLAALEAEHYAPNLQTDVLVAYIASFQLADGRWWMGGVARAPLEEGAIIRTALAVRMMKAFGTPAMKAEFDQHIVRARKYLETAKAISTDDAAMQILGLQWAGGSPAKIAAVSKTLLAAQRGDGGWSQNPSLMSDAYATGETLCALKDAGIVKVGDLAYQKGVRYLMNTQAEDGSWYVRSRAPKFQPYFQSGFPYDHDQWISSPATAWAVRALAPAAELQKRAAR
jgi:ankyrin repeat protein